MAICRSYELYGLSNYHRVIDEIMALCSCVGDRFPVAVLTSEALTNAFVHGNRRDGAKAIILRVHISRDELMMQIKDGGAGLGSYVPAREAEPDPWGDGGRGLVLMRHYADDVRFDSNTVIIKKRLCTGL